jgi:glycosyltransferase involved in cell wall biosynthesis
MKVLYLGVYKDGTGWGNAAQNYILALDSAGVEVVPRAIKLSHSDRDVHVPQRILELEENEERGCDVCIQHVIPDMMKYCGRFDLNIGMFACETTHFKNTRWAAHLNAMDQVWVFNRHMIVAAAMSNVYAPMYVVPHCFDMTKYSQHYEPYPIPETEDRFVFYTMCEVTRRKNLAGLLKAFHAEFTPNEPVSLMIKGHVPGASPMESSRILKGMIADIKTGLRLYPQHENYHNEILLTQWLNDEDMMRLHRTGDCFVLPSYGEAWGIPGFEAMAMGNPVVLTDEGGPADYVGHNDSGLLIGCKYEPVMIMPNEAPLPDVWIGNEDWAAADLSHLRHLMRKVYEDKALRDKISAGGIDRAYDFSHEIVGGQMKQILLGLGPQCTREPSISTDITRMLS